MSILKLMPGVRRRFRPSWLAAWHNALLLPLIFPSSALSDTPPDAGRILQETRPQQDRPPAAVIPPIKAPFPERLPIPAVKGEVRVQVTHFTFTGNSALSEDTLKSAVAEWAGRSLNFGQLIQVVEQIEARYRADGYFLAQAYLPPQNIRDGAIEIAITEGRLGETRLEGESRVAPEVVYGYLDRIPKGQAVTLPQLERQILLINELAGGQATLDLQAGDAPGSTDIVLAQRPEPWVTGRMDINNHGSPSTGEKRLGLALNANSPMNLGERLSFNAITTETSNLTSYNLRYELPVGGNGLHLTAGASRAEYALGGAFANLGASGTADAFRLGALYPFLRSRAANFKLQVDADQTRLNDQGKPEFKLDKQKQSSGVTVAANADWLDESGGGASTRIDFAVRHGKLTIDDNNAMEDAKGLNTAGNFTKATLTAQRTQTLTPELTLQLQITAQIAAKNLDSSEKLSLGGPATLPGYPNGEAAGDQGALARLNLRWQIRNDLALGIFADYATLQLAHTPLPAATVNTTTVNHRHLSDIGLSGDWLIGKGFSVAALLAWAGRENPGSSDNDKPRLWFSLGYGW